MIQIKIAKQDKQIWIYKILGDKVYLKVMVLK